MNLYAFTTKENLSSDLKTVENLKITFSRLGKILICKQ